MAILEAYLQQERLCLIKSPFIHTGLQPGGKTLHVVENRFNGFLRETPKTVQTVFCCRSRSGTGLKPGVNDTTFEGKASKNEQVKDPETVLELLAPKRHGGDRRDATDFDPQPEASPLSSDKKFS